MPDATKVSEAAKQEAMLRHPLKYIEAVMDGLEADNSVGRT